MSFKKILVIGFFVVVSSIAVSAINSQESTNDLMIKFVQSLPENCQESIKRFPTNLQSGWERGYIAATSTGQMTDEDFNNIMVCALWANYIKINVILKGKGSEKFADSNKTFSQFYQELKVGPMGAAVMLQMLTAVTGNSGGINWDTWEQNLMAFL